LAVVKATQGGKQSPIRLNRLNADKLRSLASVDEAAGEQGGLKPVRMKRDFEIKAIFDARYAGAVRPSPLVGEGGRRRRSDEGCERDL
jgi:hypothetical protein